MPRQELKARLFSVQYKSSCPGNETGFNHIDLKVAEGLASCRCHQLIETTVSLDHEDERKCTHVVPGFHRNIAEWWDRVKKCGVVRDRFVARIYLSM